MKMYQPSTLLSAAVALLMLAGCDSDEKHRPQDESRAASEVRTVKSNELTSAIQTYSAEQFFETTSFSGSSLNGDGSAVLMNSDESGVVNVYRQPLDGSSKTPLTQSTTDATYGVSWFPSDDRILFTADQGGNELNHLYVRETDGTITDLTPGENLKASFVGWHQDDKSFFVTSNERDPKAMDVYQYQVSDYSRALVFQNDDALSIGSVSSDGRWLVLIKANTNTDNDMLLIDLTQPEKDAIMLSSAKDNVSYSPYGFSHDNLEIYYGTNEFGEFQQAWKYVIASGKHSLVYQTNWDVLGMYTSPQGKYQVVAINNDASTEFVITNTSTNLPVKLPELPDGDFSGVNFSKDEQTMVFYLNSDTSPRNLYVHKMGSEKAIRLTDAMNPAINEDHLVTSDVVRFKSFDGLEVPGLLLKPKQASADNPVPAIIFIHGGPGGQSRKGYRAIYQHLVNHGYAIFAVNNRGSSGYGKTFYHLDDKKHGEDDLQDIVYSKYYLQTLDWVQKDKIAVMGGSYGGYLTMAAMTFTDEFALGINIFGVTNWERTLTSIPPWWESFKAYLYAEMGDPATDLERLRRISPLFHADKIKNPVLVVQGANDPRVLQVESDEMVEAIRANNVPVEYVLFPDEGHGFRKKENQITAQKAYLEFLQTHL